MSAGEHRRDPPSGSADTRPSAPGKDKHDKPWRGRRSQQSGASPSGKALPTYNVDNAVGANEHLASTKQLHEILVHANQQDQENTDHRRYHTVLFSAFVQANAVCRTGVVLPEDDVKLKAIYRDLVHYGLATVHEDQSNNGTRLVYTLSSPFVVEKATLC